DRHGRSGRKPAIDRRSSGRLQDRERSTMNMELLSRFGATRVPVLGDAIVDEYLSVDCSHLSPEAPVPVLRVKSLRQTLGGAANTAANITALGGHAQWIALTGADASGERLAALCQEASIDLIP